MRGIALIPHEAASWSCSLSFLLTHSPSPWTSHLLTPHLTLPVLRDRLRTAPVGTRVQLTVKRDGKSRDLTVVLRDLV